MADVDLKAKITVAPVITHIGATEDKKILLRWEKSPLAEKYDIERSFTPDGEYTHIDWATGTEFTDSTAEGDTTYWYKVVAWKRLENKKTSEKASTVRVTVASDIPCAAGLSVDPREQATLLSWENIPGCRYNIYRRSDFFSHPVLIGQSESGSFADENAVSGQLYHYCLQTVRSGAEGELHGNFCREVPGAFIDKAQIASVRSFFGRVSIDVSVVAGADGYIFERSSTKNGEFTEVGRTKDIADVTFEEKLPSRLRNYYYRVRAYKKAGEREYLGAYSAVKAVR